MRRTAEIVLVLVMLAAPAGEAAVGADPGTDHEFDDGSKVAITDLTPVQTENLATLGKVWGFLKYHHPRVVQGKLNWDYELFRVMPSVLAAADGARARQAIFDWVNGLGEVAPCRPCSELPEDLALRPDVAWIASRALLGVGLSAALDHIYRNRPAVARQYYVTMARAVGNPQFTNETDYPTPVLPDAGFRILALFRWWNVIQYWSPNRDLIGGDWDKVLRDFLPRMVGAADVERYRLEVLGMIATVNDGHANLRKAIEVRPPRGDCAVPAGVRWIESKPVVATRFGKTKLEAGDVIRTLDGVPIDRLIAPWRPYYSASNDDARMSAIMTELTQGNCGPVRIGIERDGAPIDVSAERIPRSQIDSRRASTHDTPGPAFRRLSPEVAYLKLSDVRIAKIDEYLAEAEGSKGWIIDIRNYPSEFVVFHLGGHFVTERTPFVRFTFGQPSNPGAFTWMDPPLEMVPLSPRYSGKVVILVDETTMSQAEYTAMAFRVSPGAVVVGSTTRGADGNVSRVPLPGGLESLISGIGVFYPDKRPTQRIGIVPDVEVRPTVAGIREGRDEVLEAAIRQIVGTPVSDDAVHAVTPARRSAGP